MEMISRVRRRRMHHQVSVTKPLIFPLLVSGHSRRHVHYNEQVAEQIVNIINLFHILSSSVVLNFMRILDSVDEQI